MSVLLVRSCRHRRRRRKAVAGICFYHFSH